MAKLYCVKGYQLEKIEELKVITFTEKDEKKQPDKFKRKLVILAKDLTYQQAKETCQKYKHMGASIFPNVKEEKLKVIQLS